MLGESGQGFFFFKKRSCVIFHLFISFCDSGSYSYVAVGANGEDYDILAHPVAVVRIFITSICYSLYFFFFLHSPCSILHSQRPLPKQTNKPPKKNRTTRQSLASISRENTLAAITQVRISIYSVRSFCVNKLIFVFLSFFLRFFFLIFFAQQPSMART